MEVYGPDIVSEGLFFCVDVHNSKSYPGSGSLLKDLVKNNNITLFNTPTYGTVNSIGYLDFNGTSQYGSITGLSYTPYCIDIWFNNDDNITTSIMQGDYQVLSGFGDYPMGIMLGAFFGNSLGVVNETVSFVDNNPSFNATYIRDTISSGIHNLVINWNGSTYDFWVDGIKKTTYSSNNGHATLTSRDSIFLAKEDNGGGYEFDGKIFRCSIYTSQLTDSQVLQNYNALKIRFV